MSAYLQLHNTIRNYAWGSHTAIAHIQGRERSNRPEAELWIGTHPGAPSRVRVTSDAELEPLGKMLEREGRSWFGGSTSTFGHRLPFLLKILAAAQPLSLQVHPSRERAQAVFSKEGRGIYVDANHKPEILCALTEFRALQGFRPFAEAARFMAQLSEVPPTINAAIESCVATPSAECTQRLFSSLLSLDPEQATAVAAAVHRSCSSRCAESMGGLPTEVAAAIDMLYQHYPNDALVIAPLLLNVVILRPGQALFTGAGTLHSYLEGTGIELMSTSDNVLRAGLTQKQVNVAELLNVTRFEELDTAALTRETHEGSSFASFPTPAEEFELAILEWQDHQEAIEPDPREVQVLLCTSGQFTVRGRSQSTQTDQNQVCSGEALLVRANGGPYAIQGQGQLFRATVPTVTTASTTSSGPGEDS